MTVPFQRTEEIHLISKKNLDFQRSFCLEKSGIPISSMGGGQIFSGIAQFTIQKKSYLYSKVTYDPKAENVLYSVMFLQH